MRIFLTAPAFIFLLLSCTGKQNEARFAIVEEYLNPEYLSELGIRFRPPADWQELPRAVVTAAIESAQTAQDSGPVQIVPGAVFFHRRNGSTCVLSQIRFRTAGDVNQRIEALEIYRTRLKQLHSQKELEEMSFRVNTFQAVRLRVVNPDNVTFVLLLYTDRGDAFQLNYLLPNAAYDSEIAKIASSIGTINEIPDQ